MHYHSNMEYVYQQEGNLKIGDTVYDENHTAYCYGYDYLNTRLKYTDDCKVNVSYK